jgi:hypothetical protein
VDALEKHLDKMALKQPPEKQEKKVPSTKGRKKS